MQSRNRLESTFYNEFNGRQLTYRGKEKSYKVKAVRPGKVDFGFDFLIEIGRRAVAVVEIKSSSALQLYDYGKITQYAAQNDIRFIILTDNELFIVIDRNQNTQRRYHGFDDFIRAITSPPSPPSAELKQSISNRIGDIFKNSTYSRLMALADSIENNPEQTIHYDEINHRYFFADPTNINSVENLLFRALLNDDKPINRVYRYTTLSTLFATLNYNSFRMNCLVGMNDTSEVNYAESYLTNKVESFENAPWQTIDAHNRRFISSCSQKRDDLTQWRLYADDSKGVCLILKVKPDFSSTDFLVKKISYGETSGKHPELDFVKTLILTLKDDFGIILDLKTLGTWRHFFKPADYAVEEEVRILYTQTDRSKSKDWLLTASHNILNPFVQFTLNAAELPVELSEIVLGPKCPEKEINKKQLEQFIRELRNRTHIDKLSGALVPTYNIPDLSVSISKIKNYR
jgi:hypothetical protein